MPTISQEEHDPTLPPPGNRWGSGAQSVLPYLTKSLQARPTAAPEQVAQPMPGEGKTVYTDSPPARR